VSVPNTCPRCGAGLRAPGLMSSDWVCDVHGAVVPLRVLPRTGPDTLRQVAEHAGVPVWCPLPMLPGWSVTGVAVAGHERGKAAAVAVALSGPCPVGGPADMVLVAEEPGTGLGARYAGMDAVDPGLSAAGAPDAKLEASGHDTPLWRCETGATDRAAFVGEAGGVWLWAVLWPPTAELVLIEDVALHDLRDAVHVGEVVPIGAATTRLAG